MQNVEQYSLFGAIAGRTALPHCLHAPRFTAFRNSAIQFSVQNNKFSPDSVGKMYFRFGLGSIHQPHAGIDCVGGGDDVDFLF